MPMRNEIELIPTLAPPAFEIEDSATRVIRRRNGVQISDVFAIGSVAFHTRRYVYRFGYAVDFAERVTPTVDRVWLTCNR